MVSRRLAVALIAGLAIAGGVVAGSHRAPVELTVAGKVLDLAGNPIASARVTMDGQATTTNEAGTFVLALKSPEGWLRADADGFLPRLRPARAGSSVLLRLTPDDGQTISIVFGGDVMFGRHFFDPNGDGDRSDGQLSLSASVADHEELLASIREPLAAADLSIVNLETPLLAQPYMDERFPRPSTFHQTKSFVFASLPQSAQALKNSGVDVVGLGNNHFHDALDAGSAETLRWLDAAGFAAGSGRAGAGMHEPSAWQPALVPVRGTSVAVLACTTVDGTETPPLNVARGDGAGAAECSDPAIRAAVQKAKQAAEVVVLMIHGGFEYVPAEGGSVRELTGVAHDAGAVLVVNGHPHVVGGFEFGSEGLTAWTMGDLLFDQTVWPTFQSYLLTVHVRSGRPIRAMVDPLIIDDFRPAAVVGELAAHVARGAGGRGGGDFVVDDGALEILDPSFTVRDRKAFDFREAARNAVMWLPDASRFDAASLPAGTAVGHDLLWTGSFEDEVADRREEAAPLWLIEGDGRTVGSSAAAAGVAGVHIGRTAGYRADAVLQPTHRVTITQGTTLTFLATIRSTSVAPLVALQFSWYNDLKGASVAQSVATVHAGPQWSVVRVDLVAPVNAVAVLPLIRLAPPTIGRSGMDVDNVRLIEWRNSAYASEADDYLRLSEPSTFTLLRSSLPGSVAGIEAPLIVSAVAPIELSAPPPLPPIPSDSPFSGDD